MAEPRRSQLHRCEWWFEELGRSLAHQPIKCTSGSQNRKALPPPTSPQHATCSAQRRCTCLHGEALGEATRTSAGMGKSLSKGMGNGSSAATSIGSRAHAANDDAHVSSCRGLASVGIGVSFHAAIAPTLRPSKMQEQGLRALCYFEMEEQGSQTQRARARAQPQRHSSFGQPGWCQPT